MVGIDVAATLRKARQRRGLSLQEVSARTNISSSVLAAIERNAFHQIPGGLYTRGYLRAFGKEVGVDGDWLIGEYASAATAGDDVVAGLRTRFHLARRQRRYGLDTAVVIVCIICLLLVLSREPERTDAPVLQPASAIHVMHPRMPARSQALGHTQARRVSGRSQS